MRISDWSSDVCSSDLRIRGKAIGAVQSGAGDFADRIEPVDIGVCGKIGQHAAASEMCGRHDWNRLIADVESERQAVRVNTRKVVLDEVRRLVRDVEIHMTQTQAFHLEVDTTGDVGNGRKSLRERGSK